MESCCICLDPPQPDNSLHLISCGCQGAWFHEPCQNLWLLNTGKLACPICRRDIPFQITYNFSHPILRLVKFLFVLELFLYNATVIGQGTAILALPFVFPCSRDFLFFAKHYSIHSILDMFFIGEKERIFFRYIHLIILATYINHIKRVEPFTPFVTGRAIIYSKSLEFAPASALTATQPTTNATEGDKPRRSGRRR